MLKKIALLKSQQNTMSNNLRIWETLRKVLDVTEKSIKRVDGRYVVGITWRGNANLPNNYALARRRLDSRKQRLKKQRAERLSITFKESIYT